MERWLELHTFRWARHERTYHNHSLTKIALITYSGKRTSPHLLNIQAENLNALRCQGDPFDTSVLLWTRAVPVSPDGSSELPDQSLPACVSFKITTSSDLTGRPADTGTAFTSYDVDWTTKLEAKGLKPDTKYFFQFADCANPVNVSPVGTTRTLPSPNSKPHCCSLKVVVLMSSSSPCTAGEWWQPIDSRCLFLLSVSGG